LSIEYLPLPGLAVEDIDTPALIIDIGAADENIRKLQAWCDAHNLGVRPHAKTHKSPFWAHRQLEAGAIGLCASKVSEAEVLINGGVSDVMITSQIVGRPKIERLMGLAGRANVTVAVDREDNVRDLSEAAVAHGAELGVVVEVNVGQDRCGTLPGEATTSLARAAEAAPGLRFDGLLGYEGHVVATRDAGERKAGAEAAMDRLFAAADGVEAAGLPVNVLSAAGTGTYNVTGAMDRITDVQCGSYIFMDGDYMEVMDDFRPALSVLSTVVSRPAPDLAVLDVGRKSISMDRGFPKVLGIPGAEVFALSEEHGKMSVTQKPGTPAVGEKVALLPMHGDTTIALHTNYFVARAGKLESIVDIAARGCFT